MIRKPTAPKRVTARRKPKADKPFWEKIVERGKRIPNLETLLLISDALGIELSVIIAEASKPSKQKRQ